MVAFAIAYFPGRVGRAIVKPPRHGNQNDPGPDAGGPVHQAVDRASAYFTRTRNFSVHCALPVLNEPFGWMRMPVTAASVP